MDLRSQYQGLSKDALIDKLLALDSHHEREPSSQASLDQSSQNAAPSTLEQLFLDHLSDGVIVTDNHSKIIWWNTGAEKMFGHSADEALGKGVGDLLHPDLESKYRLAIRHGLEQKGRWVGQIPTLCKDGTLTLCDSVVLRRLGADGQALGTIGVNRNTGWQVKAEAAMVLQQGTQSQLEASLQRYKELIECIPDLVWTVNIDGVITYMSPAAEKLTGYKPEDLLGTHFYDSQAMVLDPQTPDSPIQRLESLLKPESRDDGFVSRNVYHRADGSLLDAEVRVSPHLDAYGKVIGLIGITRDVGDIVQAQQAKLSLEAQLLQAQKMEAVGQLAGGIAHDLNNVLTTIIGHTELLLLGLETTAPQFSGLSEIDSSSQRAARLVKNLLVFSRQQKLRPQLVDMGESVAQMEGFLQGLLGGSIELSIRAESESLFVLVDLAQLEQVVMNLVVNARDAIGELGQINVTMKLIDLKSQQEVPLPQGRYVSLAVSDTGSGIEPDSIPRVFEPFYTTKKPNTGTGLGLSSAYGIIQQSGGTIDVVSEVGVGATFSVYLPFAASGSVADTPQAFTNSPQTPLQGVTVLIAEDNPEVGSMLKRVLEQSGYSVLLAQSAVAALDIARHTIGRIDLLITDYGMPGMNGLELGAELASLHQETKVLHMSGYSDELFTDKIGEPMGQNFLPKPFGPKALLERVSQILDSSFADS